MIKCHRVENVGEVFSMVEQVMKEIARPKEVRVDE